MGKLVEPDKATGGNIMWCVLVACSITKATNIPSEYAILIPFPQ
jgi:hypothetical protein